MTGDTESESLLLDDVEEDDPGEDDSGEDDSGEDDSEEDGDSVRRNPRLNRPAFAHIILA